MIEKCLELPTLHLKPETVRYLTDVSDEPDGLGLTGNGVAVYRKGVYGFFLVLNSRAERYRKTGENPAEKHGLASVDPPDLDEVIEYAVTGGCNWIILDCDAGVMPGRLPLYGDEWDAWEKAGHDGALRGHYVP